MSRVGDEMLDKMGKATPRARSGAGAHGRWEDDDTDLPPAAGVRRTAPTVVSLMALGPQTRPNGAVYQPRAVVEDYEDVALLRDARVHQEHVLFYGPPGTGKTALAEAAFARDATTEHDGLETILGTADTTEADFVGTFVQDPRSGAFEWRPGPLHRSVLFDVPLLVDEIALIDPRVLSVLYPLMDGRGVLRITMNPELEPLTIGPNWFVLAAYNPDVPGAVLSEALRDRFSHHIEVNTDWQLALDLGVPADVVQLAKNLDTKRLQGDLRWSPQLRSLLDYAATARRRGEDYALANLLAKVPGDDRATVAEAMKDKFGEVTPLRLGSRFAA